MISELCYITGVTVELCYQSYIISLGCINLIELNYTDRNYISSTELYYITLIGTFHYVTETVCVHILLSSKPTGFPVRINCCCCSYYYYWWFLSLIFRFLLFTMFCRV